MDFYGSWCCNLVQHDGICTETMENILIIYLAKDHTYEEYCLIPEINKNELSDGKWTRDMYNNFKLISSTGHEQILKYGYHDEFMIEAGEYIYYLNRGEKTNMIVDNTPVVTAAPAEPEIETMIPETTTTTSTTTTTTTTSAATSTTTSITTANEENVTLTYSLGDVNTDGILDGRDATAILTYYAITSTGSEFNNDGFNAEYADYNKDSVIDGRDATAVLTYYAKSSVFNRC